MIIPCKDCLVLAACRHKEEIDCGALYEWIEMNRSTAGKLVEYLPNWLIILSKPKDDEGVPCFRRSWTW
jgi:hypothetical protein